MSVILLIGGSGFIGTNLAHRIMSSGQSVLIFDNLSRAGVERNLAWLRKIHRDLTSGYERIQLLERANRAARGWLTASTLAYDIGTGDARQLTESFLAWAASEAELQKTRYDMHLAHADYARAAGQLIARRR